MFFKCSPGGKRLSDSVWDKREKDLKQSGLLRNLNIVLWCWSIEYRGVLLQDMRMTFNKRL